jgi:hypothetical protein
MIPPVAVRDHDRLRGIRGPYSQYRVVLPRTSAVASRTGILARSAACGVGTVTRRIVVPGGCAASLRLDR